MIVDRQMEQAIVDGLTAEQLQRMASEAGMVSLAEAAQVRVLRGETTAPEAMRVLDDAELILLAAASRDAEPGGLKGGGCSPYG